jgi:hypothetical protein
VDYVRKFLGHSSPRAVFQAPMGRQTLQNISRRFFLNILHEKMLSVISDSCWIIASVEMEWIDIELNMGLVRSFPDVSAPGTDLTRSLGSIRTGLASQSHGTPFGLNNTKVGR